MLYSKNAIFNLVNTLQNNLCNYKQYEHTFMSLYLLIIFLY